VRDRERNVFYAEVIGDLSRGALEADRGLAAGLARDFDIAPSDAAAPARPERLHGGFFRSETGRISLELVAMAFAVGDFGGSEQSIEERLAVARDGSLDAVDFGDVEP